MPELFQNVASICLASASPRRKDFLQNLGLSFTVKTVPDAEPLPENAEQPSAFAIRSALAKAYAVARVSPIENTVIIAADTVVTINEQILGKPENPEHGLAMLEMLNGNRHVVISACAVLVPCKEKWVEKTFFEETQVNFWNVPKAALKAYAYSKEPQDKAGGYAINGAGCFMVESVTGSVNNVVGLPLTSLISFLLAENIICTA